MLPTMSIGIVSVNLPLSVKAQNGAISQERGGEAAQGIEQELATEHCPSLTVAFTTSLTVGTMDGGLSCPKLQIPVNKEYTGE